MPFPVSNANQTPADVVTLKQVQSSTSRKETSAGKAAQRPAAAAITLPEDVVTLSSSSRSKAEDSLLAKRNPSQAVTIDEKQALLGATADRNGFSIHV